LQTALAVDIMVVRIESGLLKFDDVGHPLQWILIRSLPEATVSGGRRAGPWDCLVRLAGRSLALL